MNQRGQISILIIIGTVLVILISFGAWYYNTNIKQNIQKENIHTIQKERIEFLYEQCTFELTKNITLHRIGPQGGYIDPEYNELELDYDQVPFRISGPAKIPLWYSSQGLFVPQKEKIETKIGRYVLLHLENCLDLDNTFPSTRIDMSFPDLSPSEILAHEDDLIIVTINTDDIEVNLQFPVTLQFENEQIELQQIKTKIPIPLGRSYDVAFRILTKMLANPSGYNIEPECFSYSGNGYTTISTFNNIMIINDFSNTPVSPFYETFKFQYAYENLWMFGECVG